MFIEILNSTSIRTQLGEAKGPKMIANNFEPSFYLRNMLKDLDLAALKCTDCGGFVAIDCVGATNV